METPSQIIDALGGYRQVAAILTKSSGEPVSPNRVHNWTRRSIPGDFWYDLVQAAEKKDIKGVTIDVLRSARVG